MVKYLKILRIVRYILDKIKFKKAMHILFYQILAYTIHGKKYKSHIKNNKFRISAPTWNDIRYLRLY